jgi:hypothetical protein
MKLPSQTSPPPGFRSGPAGRTASGQSGDAPGRPQAADPSWARVISTTLRLWLRRKVLRVPDSGRVGAARRTAVLAAVVVVAAAVAVTAVALSLPSSAPVASRPAARVPVKRHPAVSPVVAAQQRAAAANLQAAAAWITAQVSQQATIECDPAAAGQLMTDGFPAAQADLLEPGETLPALAGPAGGPAATLFLQTPALGTQYRAELTDTAPVILASFGAGPSVVRVRLVLPGGAAAAAQDATQALSARQTAGRALVKSRRARLRSAPQRDLQAGAVDPRLITVLHRMAAAAKIYVLNFSNPASPADPAAAGDPAAPLRVAEVGGLLSQRDGHQVSEVKAMLKLLRKQQAPYLAGLRVRYQAGKPVLTITFPAPSPF